MKNTPNIKFLKIYYSVVITTDFYKIMCYNIKEAAKQIENGGL